MVSIFHIAEEVNFPKEINGVDPKKREREAGQPASDATCGAMLQWTARNCVSLRAVFSMSFLSIQEWRGRPRPRRKSSGYWLFYSLGKTVKHLALGGRWL